MIFKKYTIPLVVIALTASLTFVAIKVLIGSRESTSDITRNQSPQEVVESPKENWNDNGSTRSLPPHIIDGIGFHDDHEHLIGESFDAVRDAERRNLEWWLHAKFIDGIPYLESNHYLGEKREEYLVSLHAALSSPDEAPEWEQIAVLIGFLGGLENSQDVLIDYITRLDDLSALSETNRFNALSGKIGSLYWLGLVPLDEVGSDFLRQMATAEGAREVASIWIGNEDNPDGFTNIDPVIRSLRGAAACGLVYSGNPENIAYFHEMYRREIEVATATGRAQVDGQFIDAMAYLLYIEEHGKDKFMALYGDDMFNEIFPYVTRALEDWPDN